jgi:hypothetical protein
VFLWGSCPDWRSSFGPFSAPINESKGGLASLSYVFKCSEGFAGYSILASWSTLLTNFCTVCPLKLALPSNKFLKAFVTSALKRSYLVVWLSRTATDELWSGELLALFAIPAMLLVPANLLPNIANWLAPYCVFNPLMISVCYSIYCLCLWFNCRSWSQPYRVCSN